MGETSKVRVRVHRHRPRAGRSVWLVTDARDGRIIRVRSTWRGAMDSACAHLRRRGSK